MNFFGNPTSSAQGTSLFGGNTNLNPASNAGTSSTGLFGAQGVKPVIGGGLFGASSNTTGTGTIFGGSTPAPAQPAAAAGGTLFGGGPSSNTPSSNPLFGGGPSSNTSAATTGSNPLFGGSTSAFSLPKPTDQNSGSSKLATSSFFSQPNASTTGLFNLPPKPADSTNVNSSQNTTTTPALGGGLFGKPAATSSTTPMSIPVPKSTSGFPPGGNKDLSTVATASTSAFSLGTNKDSATSSGGLFGGKPAEKKDGTSTAPVPTFNLFGGAMTDDKKDNPAATNTSATTSTDGDQGKAASATIGSLSNSVVAVPPPSMLRGKTLEEIVNRWTSELETHVREFAKFAGEVAVWDRALVENGNNLAALYSHVLAAERQQNEIDQSLDHIEQQQKDLASTLDAYEKVSQDILGGQGGLRTLDTGPADTERDKNYMLATDLHTHLDDLSGSLTQMIESVNLLSTVQKPSGDGGEDPMSQIAGILSSHLESLQWIDSAVREVDSKVSEVEKRVKDSGHSLGNGAKARGFGLNR